MNIKIWLEDGAKYPEKAHFNDAGFDLFNYSVHNYEYQKTYISYRTGVHIELPSDYCALVVSKSGLHSKQGIITDGLIDCGYTGEIVVTLNYPFKTSYCDILPIGRKIAQLLILEKPKIVLVNKFGEPYQKNFIEELRGNNGFGSTGN